jgi:hypothetical protein
MYAATAVPHRRIAARLAVTLASGAAPGRRLELREVRLRALSGDLPELSRAPPLIQA